MMIACDVSNRLLAQVRNAIGEVEEVRAVCWALSRNR